MRPLQCPSCGQSLGAMPPGPGGRRTCGRCHFSFVPIRAADAVTEGTFERNPVLLLLLVLLPFIVGGFLQSYYSKEAGDLVARSQTNESDTVLSTGTGEAPVNSSAPESRPATGTTTAQASGLSATPAPKSTSVYPAVIEQIEEPPEGLPAVAIISPQSVAPPAPIVPRARITIVSNPPGASVVIVESGIGVGNAPLFLDLIPGFHQFRLSLPGWKAKILPLNVYAGQVRQVEVQLAEEETPRPGRIAVDSEPIQAEVYLDGRSLGFTPLSVELAGNSEVELLFQKEGFEDITLQVRVSSGGTQNVRAILPPVPEESSTSKTQDPALAQVEALDRLVNADGTAPPLGAYRSALPVQGSAASSQRPPAPSLSPDTEGSISGLVVLEGEPPAIRFITVTADAQVCGSTPRAAEDLAVAPNGGLQNVVVRLVDPELDKQLGPPVADSSLQIINCRLLPHVQAFPVGTSVRLSNLQNIPFGILFTDATGVETARIALPARRVNQPLSFETPGIFHVSETGGHDWMKASIHVMSNPYYTISDVGGQFSISAVPIGDYTLETWHETLGSRATRISIAAGQTTTARFEYQLRREAQ